MPERTCDSSGARAADSQAGPARGQEFSMQESAPAAALQGLLDDADHSKECFCPGKQCAEVDKREGAAWRAPVRALLRALLNLLIGAAVLVVVIWLERTAPPSGAAFLCGDPALTAPSAVESVTLLHLLLTALLAPPMLISAVELARSQRPRRTALASTLLWLREYVAGAAIATPLMMLAKLVARSPRPSFLAECRPDAALTCRPGEYVRQYTCTNDNTAAVRDSTRSFPSGHAMLSVYAGLVMFWFLGRRARGLGPWLLAPALQLGALAWAALVCVSRVADGRHHWWDVLAGAALGAAAASYVVVQQCGNFHMNTSLQPYPLRLLAGDSKKTGVPTHRPTGQAA